MRYALLRYNVNKTLTNFFIFPQSENFGLTSPSTSSFPTAQSTPVAAKRSSSLQTPNTSELEESGRTSPIRSHKLSDAPRTPTPFKRALADVYQRGDPISNTVSFIKSNFKLFTNNHFYSLRHQPS